MTEYLLLSADVLLSMVNSFIIAATMIVFLQSFYDNGIVWSRKKACVLGVYVIIEALLLHFFPDVEIISTLLFFVYAAIAVYDCKEKKIRRYLRIVVTYGIISISVVSIAIFGFIYLLPGFDVNSPVYTDAEARIINISSSLFFGFIFYYIKNRLIGRNIFIRCGKRESFTVAVYLFFVFFMLVMGFASTEESSPTPSFISMIIKIFAAVCLVFMIFLPISLFHSKIGAHYRRANELHETYMQAQLEHFSQYKAAQAETARLRHDMQNNLRCLYDILASGKTEEASDYLSDLLSEVNALSPKYVSGDEMLDCIISSKASVMEQENIDFFFDGAVPGGLSWNAMDVCNVFANALDNAIEACVKLPVGKRQISMTVKSTEQLRYIRIENPTAQAVDTDRLFRENGGYTTKKHSAGHGMGTYSIKRTAEKYGGVVRAECTDGVFTLELILNKSSCDSGLLLHFTTM